MRNGIRKRFVLLVQFLQAAGLFFEVPGTLLDLLLKALCEGLKFPFGADAQRVVMHY